tara:strand:+ start:1949 stop:2110 length:162 start_codon:yes stop_codon:yes gene_type:complete
VVHSDKAVFALAVIASECIVFLEEAEEYDHIVESFNDALAELGEDWETNFRIG